MNKALIGSYTQKLLLDVHVCRSYWILTHMTIISILLLDTVSLYQTEPTVALGQIDLATYRDVYRL